MSLELWLVFIVVWAATTAPVGPNVINLVATSSQRGFKHALWAVPGIGLAALVHITIGLTGLATLLMTNKYLFNIVRFGGAAYMVYMAYCMWRDQGMSLKAQVEGGITRLQTFRQGFLISLSNPKAILVNVAIFSQFIDQTAPLANQLYVLIPSALIIDALIYGGYCVIGSGIGRLLGKPARQKLFNRSVGLIYLLVGFGFITYEPSASGKQL